MKRSAGFTLIEVLVALAIVAVALAAVMRATAVATDDQAQLRDRRLAWLCAQDRWAELRLQAQPAGDARWQCQQGRWRFIGVQQRGTNAEGQPEMALTLFAEHDPRRRLLHLVQPWSP